MSLLTVTPLTPGGTTAPAPEQKPPVGAGPPAPPPAEEKKPGAVPAEPGPAALTRPDHVPEKFWKDGAVDADGLAKSYTELERRQGTLKQEWEAERLKSRPPEPAAYAVPEVAGMDKAAIEASPITGWLRRVAHDNGWSQEIFQGQAKAYLEQMKAMLPDPKAELTALGDNAGLRLDALSAWAQQTFSDADELAAISGVAATATGVRALERVMMLAKGIGADLRSPAALPPQESEAEIKSLMGSDAYWQKDPATLERVQRYFEKAYA